MADVSQSILDDGGYKSRKFVALLVYWGLVTLALAGAIRWGVLKDLFVTYWTGLSAGLAAYYGVNWGHSYLAAGTGKTSTAVVQEQESDSLGAAKVPGDDDSPPKK